MTWSEVEDHQSKPTVVIPHTFSHRSVSVVDARGDKSGGPSAIFAPGEVPYPAGGSGLYQQ